MVQIVNVVKLTAKLFALVYKVSLVALQHVDQNVSSAPIVHKMKLARIKNVVTLAQEHVASVPNVALLITTQYAVVLLAIQVIHLFDVNRLLSNHHKWNQLIHVDHHHVVRMPSAVTLVIHHLAVV